MPGWSEPPIPEPAGSGEVSRLASGLYTATVELSPVQLPVQAHATRGHKVIS